MRHMPVPASNLFERTFQVLIARYPLREVHMPEQLGAEAGLLVLGVIILNASILLYIITGKPRLRYLLLLDISLLFWIISYGMNLLTHGPQMTGTWQFMSLMGMTLLIFSFIAAFVDYLKNGD